MNIYTLLGLLKDLELPDGVISVGTRTRKPCFIVHMETPAFMAAFPQHASEVFDDEYQRCYFEGENVTVMCLVSVASSGGM